MKKFTLMACALFTAFAPALAQTYDAKPMACSWPEVVSPATDFDLTVKLRNMGDVDIFSLTIEVTIGSEAAQSIECTPAEPITANKQGTVTARAKCLNPGADLSAVMRITHVNGQENKESSLTYTAYLKCLSEGYVQNVVCEEATATGCGYCPIGIVGLDKMHEYAPGRFIPIAVHNARQGEDAMDVCSAGRPYQPFLSYSSGNPASFLNRNFAENVNPSYNDLLQHYEAIKDQPALCQITGTLESTGDKSVRLHTTSTFILDLPDADYGVAYTILEDNLGPYNQVNYYSTEYGADADNGCPEWSDKPGKVPTYYNHIARRGSVYAPVDASLPIELTAGKEVDFDADLDLTYVKNKQKYSVVAMVVNRRTGRIENATTIYPSDYDGVRVITTDNTIQGPTEYYTLQGIRLSEPPTTGLYIERSGNTAHILAR